MLGLGTVPLHFNYIFCISLNFCGNLLLIKRTVKILTTLQVSGIQPGANSDRDIFLSACTKKMQRSSVSLGLFGFFSFS